MSAVEPLTAGTHIPGIWSYTSPRTLDELSVLKSSVELREKDDWRRKAQDAQIQAKWKKEAIEQHQFSESMAQFLVDKLKHESTRWLDEARGIESTGIPGVVRSDRLFIPDVVQELSQLSAQLEDSMEVKDWHPNSNETVLDVVHPSLYCLVDDHTRVFDESAEVHFLPNSRDLTPWFTQHSATIFAASPEVQKDSGYDFYQPVSHTMQWLPSDFAVDAEGRVRTLSYINNLHPDPTQPSGKLYDILERVLEGFVPMFEASIAEMNSLQVRPQFRNGEADEHYLIESWDPAEAQDWPAETIANEHNTVEYLNSNGNGDWDTSENRLRWAREEYWTETRKWIRIEVQPFTPTEYKTLSIKDRTLQVIVKLATIHLTPEKPAYDGGSWHVEGTHREKICATGILYFDQHNITESRLGFRGLIDEQEATESFEYEQGDHGALEALYGFQNEGEVTQQLGAITTKLGRAIAFPNGLHHQVAPFKLADPSRPGYRKILAFFLVDPLQKVISTARVAPQQLDWMQRGAGTIVESMPSSLPPEITNMIVDRAAPFIDSGRFGMSLEDAHAHRATLMEERAAQSKKVEEAAQQGFSFCEH